MTRNLSLLIALVILTLGYTWQDDYNRQHSSKTEKPEAAALTQAAPDFTFGKHKLSDFKGKVIVLNFWASWCAPCVTEFPAMLRLAKQRPEVIFIFLSLDEDKADMERFLSKMSIESKNVLIERDLNQSIAHELYQTYKLPETYIIGPDLRISEKIIGNSVIWDSNVMLEKLRAL